MKTEHNINIFNFNSTKSLSESLEKLFCATEETAAYGFGTT